MTETVSNPDEDWSQGFAIVVLIVFVVLYLLSGCEAARHGHRKRSLLKAYRRRHQWKKAGIPRLRQLGFSDASNALQMTSWGRGRGVVDDFHPVEMDFEAEAGKVWALIDPTTPARERIS